MTLAWGKILKFIIKFLRCTTFEGPGRWGIISKLGPRVLILLARDRVVLPLSINRFYCALSKLGLLLSLNRNRNDLCKKRWVSLRCGRRLFCHIPPSTIAPYPRSFRKPFSFLLGCVLPHSGRRSIPKGGRCPVHSRVRGCCSVICPITHSMRYRLRLRVCGCCSIIYHIARSTIFRAKMSFYVFSYFR